MQGALGSLGEFATSHSASVSFLTLCSILFYRPWFYFAESAQYHGTDGRFKRIFRCFRSSV